MLKTLNISNFALIESTNIEFDSGLNILTGETGAGKSILIDALGIVLGSRVSAGSIRNGSDQLRIEAVFLVNNDDKVIDILSELEIAIDEGNLIITRKVARNGKSSIIVNDSHVTLAALKKIGAALVDVHGQNENLALLKEDTTYNLIDNSDKEIATLLSDYQKLYKLWTTQKKSLEEKRKAAADNEQRLDMLKWQEKEISDANLKLGEDESLEAEIRRLSNAEKIAQNVEEACELLDGNEEFNVLTLLAKVEKNLNEVSRYDNSLNEARKMLEEASIILHEVYGEIHNYNEQVEFSPERLDELQERMELIYRLKRKYGATIEDVIKHYEKVKREIDAIENFDIDSAAMEEKIAKLEVQARKRAASLIQARQKAAEKLSLQIEKELRQLGMLKAQFKILVKETEELTTRGGDEIEMLFSANAGEELKLLSKTASGGELSRLSLAIKTIDAGRNDSAATLVFDEIDTGVGGVTANAVAECIAKVAKYRQVICITHLAQIACMADVHIAISKRTEEDRTLTEAEILSESARLKEIARMASGDDAAPESMENARAMLMNAQTKKRTL